MTKAHNSPPAERLLMPKQVQAVYSALADYTRAIRGRSPQPSAGDVPCSKKSLILSAYLLIGRQRARKHTPDVANGGKHGTVV